MSHTQTVEQLLDSMPRLRERKGLIDDENLKSSALLRGYVDRVDISRDVMQSDAAHRDALQRDYGHLPRVDDRADPGSDKRPGILPLSMVDEAESKASSSRENFNRVTVLKNRASAHNGNVQRTAKSTATYLDFAASIGGLKESISKIPKGATLDGIRDQTAALRKSRKAAENSITHFTPDEIPALVQAKAAPARLVLSQRGQRSISYPITRGVPDALALLCRYAPDAVIADLTEQAGQMESERGAMSPQQKAKKLAELDAEIMRLQRVEAELVWQARAAGQDVWFAKGLDIRAVLGVSGPDPK